MKNLHPQDLVLKKKTHLILCLFLMLFVFSIGNKPIICDSNFTHNLTPSSEARTIEWSGYTWNVRTSNSQLQGPGPNLFNNSLDSVWIDESDNLHLKIRKIEDNWYCSEVYTQDSLGFGTYKFVLEPGFENLDVNTVVGLFTYLDDTHEIDIEFSRWGYENNENGQYATQPASKSRNIHRYEMENQDRESIHSFTWCENYIKFESAYGSELSSDSQDLISSWYYTGSDIPDESTEHVHINFWLMSGLAPENLQEAELVIRSFEFNESECKDPNPNELSSLEIVLISIAAIGTCLLVIILIKKRIR